jgi:hypothetical protein
VAFLRGVLTWDTPVNSSSDAANRAVHLHVTVEQELDALYKRQLLCTPCHWTLFHADLLEHKKHTLPALQNWIAIYANIIRISCDRQAAANLAPQMPLHNPTKYSGMEVSLLRRGYHSY